jgi:hypothetical protein
MPEDDWDVVAQEIPAADEPFLKKYLLGRDSLIAQEQKLRSGKYEHRCFTSKHKLKEYA